MMKRFWRISMIVVLLAGFAALSFAAPQVKKHKLTLENGKIVEGEIVAVTATTISIKDAALGVIAIARENILKIEPPLDETKPAVSAPAPAPRYADQPVAPRSGAGNIRFGFSLSGGMGNINGGDFNSTIVDWNTFVSDYNDYYGPDQTYAIDWKEMSWLPKFGGEFLVRFGDYFGIGLGAEYIRKSNHGTMDYMNAYSYRDWYYWSFSFYIDTIYDYTKNFVIDQTLSVIPITLSFYGYLPLGPQAEAYVKAGAGYYLGKLTSEWSQSWNMVYHENWYLANGTPWPDHYHETEVGSYLDTSEATCNALGFHFGAGFNFNVSGNIALFAEAFYRMVDFKDWQGTGAYDGTYTFKYGWTDSTGPDGLPYSSTYNYDDSYNGKLWYYDDVWPWLDGENYGQYWMYEAGDEPDEGTYTDNVRPFELNLNGFTFKVGIKIFFGGR